MHGKKGSIISIGANPKLAANKIWHMGNEICLNILQGFSVNMSLTWGGVLVRSSQVPLLNSNAGEYSNYIQNT